MKDREKELKKLIYLKNELIKQQKKELKQLRNELYKLNEEKTYRRKHNVGGEKWTK